MVAYETKVQTVDVGAAVAVDMVVAQIDRVAVVAVDCWVVRNGLVLAFDLRAVEPVLLAPDVYFALEIEMAFAKDYRQVVGMVLSS